MKKHTLLILTLTLLTFGNLMAQTTLNMCNQAAYALGYIKEGAVKLSVNGSTASKEGQEILWTTLHDMPYLKVTRYPRDYQVGNYLKPGRYYFFEVEVTDPPTNGDYYGWQQDASSLIEELKLYPGITAGCIYLW
ncbi:MAG: hypothetical protein HN623_11580 [Bdellovibrionales bacterium]|nr:hypothetical protein [Bdellovibrionales bacterium]